jgi:hypothetical protein
MVLTSSDIGTDPESVENVLMKEFKTASNWGAVLLIDEADVFMERRSTNDLNRNCLVAGNWTSIFSSMRTDKTFRLPSCIGILRRNTVPYHQPSWGIR